LRYTFTYTFNQCSPHSGHIAFVVAILVISYIPQTHNENIITNVYVKMIFV